MKRVQKYLTLPEGTFNTEVIIFDNTDDVIIHSLYNEWRSLSKKLMEFGARGINLPEGLSEPIFCRAMNTVRLTSSIPGANTSFDVYDLNRKKRIQIKACSVIPDLTSFGPKSVWDELYFMDFYCEGNWDGTINIYRIHNDYIYNHKVNANQTMRDQQLQGRRPRFSIYSEIIRKYNMKPSLPHKI